MAFLPAPNLPISKPATAISPAGHLVITAAALPASQRALAGFLGLFMPAGHVITAPVLPAPSYKTLVDDPPAVGYATAG